MIQIKTIKKKKSNQKREEENDVNYFISISHAGQLLEFDNIQQQFNINNLFKYSIEYFNRLPFGKFQWQHIVK